MKLSGVVNWVYKSIEKTINPNKMPKTVMMDGNGARYGSEDEALENNESLTFPAIVEGLFISMVSSSVGLSIDLRKQILIKQTPIHVKP